MKQVTLIVTMMVEDNEVSTASFDLMQELETIGHNVFNVELVSNCCKAEMQEGKCSNCGEF